MGLRQQARIGPAAVVRRASLGLLPLERRHRITSISDHRLAMPSLETHRHCNGLEPTKLYLTTKRQPSWSLVLLAAGGGLAAALLLLTLVGFFSFDSALRSVADSQIRLEPGTWFYEGWRGSAGGPPFTVRYFLFGLRNRDEFLHGAAPVVQEFGPFVYRVNATRRVVRRKATTLVYRQQSHYQLEPDGSMHLDTEMWVLNYPLFAALHVVHGMLPRGPLGLVRPLLENMVSSVLRDIGENLLERRTARQLLHGRRVRFLELLSNFVQPLRALGIQLPRLPTAAAMANFSFGFGPQLSDQESSPCEHFVRTEPTHLADGLARVAGIKELPAFRPPCNRIQGSGGIFFGLDQWSATSIDFYSHELCRRITLVRNFTHRYGGAVSAIRFIVAADESSEKNHCYCRARARTRCPRDWSDASPCYGNVPAAVSLPHFYSDDRSHAVAIGGLAPNRSKHVGFIDLEPNLGLTINGRIPMQFNLRVRPIPVPGLRSLRASLVPMFWVEQSASMQPEQLYWMGLLSDTFRYGKYFILAGGLVLAALWLALLLQCATRRQRSK